MHIYCSFNGPGRVVIRVCLCIRAVIFLSLNVGPNENFELDNWLAGSCKLDIVCAKFEGHGQRFFPGRGCSGLIEN